MMIVKKHVTGDRRLILAICDDALIGSVLEEDGKQLDLSADFYRGESKTEEETAGLIAKSFSVNAVGEKSVALCMRKCVASKEEVKYIKKTPYILIVLF